MSAAPSIIVSDKNDDDEISLNDDVSNIDPTNTVNDDDSGNVDVGIGGDMGVEPQCNAAIGTDASVYYKGSASTTVYVDFERCDMPGMFDWVAIYELGKLDSDGKLPMGSVTWKKGMFVVGIVDFISLFG